MSGTSCVAKCDQENEKYAQAIEGGLFECVAACDSNAFAEEGEHLHCQESCTLFINDESTDNMNKCVEKCEGDYSFQDGNQCVNDCAFYHLEGDVKVCDAQCPTDEPYHYEEDSDTTVCVAKCPENRPWLVGNTCKEVCPNGAFTTETSDDVTHYKCADSCPVVYAEETNFEKTYKHCYDSCASAGLNYDTDGKCDMGCL